MRKKVSRIFEFLKRYTKHPLYIFVYALAYFMRGFECKIRFYSDDEVIDLLKKGKSIIRLGDGDIVNIPLDIENCYHRPDQKLKDMYSEIIKNYSAGGSYVLSVPIFLNMTNTNLAKLGKGKLEWGLPMKVMFFLRFNKNCSYMDAHNFYYDNYFEGMIAPLFKDRLAIFITNKKTIEKQKNNKSLLWQDAVYIEAPEIDAMDEYENIKRNLNRVLEGIDKNKVVIFAAMGPVGKYLVYEYANMGYQGVDIGKVSEVMFTGESIQYLI